METLHLLQKRIDTTVKLQGMVRSMKTLAAVSIRQYERAVASLEIYVAAIEQGLQVALRDYPLPAAGRRAEGRLLVVFGSDQGLCGRFNERLAEEVRGQFQGGQGEPPRLLVVGARLAARLEALGLTPAEQFWVPGSVGGINATVFQLLLTLERWQRREQPGRVELIFSRRTGRSAGEPNRQLLLPLEQGVLQRLGRRPWPGRSLPSYRLEPQQLFSGLARQFLFTSLFRAQAESLASEQASRLASLQNAEKNIEEHVAELKGEFRVKRQSTITAELLDLVAGYRVAARHRPPPGSGRPPWPDTGPDRQS